MPRNESVRRDFQRLNPCPFNGERRGPCPGYVVDHINPLCAGGADAIENMQWQSKEESDKKDKLERALCRPLPKLPK